MSLITELDATFAQDSDQFLDLAGAAIEHRRMELINLLLNTEAAKLHPLWLYNTAAMYDHFDILKLIYERLKVLEVSTCYAAQNNNLEMLKWLYEHGAQLDDDTFSSAINKGGLEMIQWLYDNKCQHGHNVYYTAIMRKSVDIIKWLNDNDFTWTHNDFILLWGNNHLQWILENKHLFGEHSTLMNFIKSSAPPTGNSVPH